MSLPCSSSPSATHSCHRCPCGPSLCVDSKLNPQRRVHCMWNPWRKPCDHMEVSSMRPLPVVPSVPHVTWLSKIFLASSPGRDSLPYLHNISPPDRPVLSFSILSFLKDPPTKLMRATINLNMPCVGISILLQFTSFWKRKMDSQCTTTLAAPSRGSSSRCQPY
jgi:hypothetical protein